MTLTQIKPAGLSKPVDLADNEKIRIGTGNDLQIYHNGVDTYLEGSLRIGKNNNVRITDGDDNTIFRTDASSAYLAYEGNDKLQSLTDGVLVTGKVAATGDLALTSSDGQKVRIGVSNDLELYHNGTNSIINHTLGSGSLHVRSNDVRLMNNAGN